MWTNNYDGYSHLIDYQINYDLQLKNRQLEFVGGFDYDFIDLLRSDDVAAKMEV